MKAGRVVRHHRDGDFLRVVRVPSVEHEDERRLHREFERLKKERTGHRNRVQSLLVTQGVVLKSGRDFLQRLGGVVLWNGEPLPADLKAELEREYGRLRLVEEQIRALEAERLKRLEGSEQAIIGYALLIFQFVFVFLCCFRPFRVLLLLIGLAFHIGIILSLNIYLFGFGMLVHYALMVPFAWWRCLGKALQVQEPTLTVFYDEQCPLCNRTVITVQHFDVCNAIAFRGLQTHARQY